MADLPGRADALWRAITYLSVAQLHLRANPLAAKAVDTSDMKPRPSGHWGTVPGTAWVLVHVGLAAGHRPDVEIIPVIGAGHAGLVQRALAWLTGDLARASPRFGRDAAGLATLVESFPDVDNLGSEVHPALPVGVYMGGWLGGALAFAQGMALDAPNRVVVPILGDGECETPTAAASWLAQRAIPGAQVLPVVHLNGHRMGGPSLLGAMSDERVSAYAQGLGWEPVVAHVGTGSPSEHSAFHRVLVDGMDAAGRGERRVVLLRCVKGWSGPTGAHKTPLTDLESDPHQQALLRQWMSSYRPRELFDDDAQPVGALASALNESRFCYQPQAAPSAPAAASPEGRGFSAEVSAVLRAHAAAGDFKVFSPDELRSNRLGDLEGKPWVHEVLAEEVLLGWLAGWTASGRRGVLISYEAFAPLLLTGLVGHLKQRRLADSTLPSINLLLTSYGWHNVYTHGDPSLVTALLGTGDPAVHVFTPADANRAALALDDALRSTGRVNVIIAGKHPTPVHPCQTVDDERRHGLAVWNHLSDAGEPDLTLICAGDLAAAAVSDAVMCIRDRHRCRVRVVNVHDLAALAGPALHRYVGEHGPALFATLGHPAVIWGLLGGRVGSMAVVGWREPPQPMPQDRLAAYAGLDVAGITRVAATLLTGRGTDGTDH
ncbi:MAG TPA: hypothetical protein VMU94_02575 [Streptosporangiaceae bacterium]|nr:hypothetical protein [Streptosporangiaceae bacterium]